MDPRGQRGFFESWIAIVDKERTKKFKAFSDRAEEIINLLPYPKEIHTPKYTSPNLAAVDAIYLAYWRKNPNTFSSRVLINDSSYHDIR